MHYLPKRKRDLSLLSFSQNLSTPLYPAGCPVSFPLMMTYISQHVSEPFSLKMLGWNYGTQLDVQEIHHIEQNI